jgi:hypothetical protein
VGWESWWADGIGERFWLQRGRGGWSENRKGGKGIRHVYGSDDDGGNVGDHFIRGTDTGGVLLIEVFNE